MENREIEATLVVLSDAPLRVVGRLEALEQLAGCTLHPLPVEELRDVYYDLPAQPLRARGLALRLRHAGGRWLLALKGRARCTAFATDRLEIEGPPAAVAGAIGRELGGTAQSSGTRPGDTGQLGGTAQLGGLAPLGADLEALERDPIAALAAAGWTAIQARDTLRRPRDLATAGGARRACMAIDTVTYTAAGRALRHHEVEIEIAAPEDLEWLERAGHDLLQRFAPEIAPWPHSKLATGFAIEALASGAGDALLADAAGDITPAGHARIHAFLQAQRTET
jgi:CYTH domain-containing protein